MYWLEYPTINENLHLDQIDFRKNYPDFEIGYSTHEEPDNFENIQIAIAKGATVFEKYAGLSNDKYDLNKYSASPVEVNNWLGVMKRAKIVRGGFTNVWKGFTQRTR